MDKNEREEHHHKRGDEKTVNDFKIEELYKLFSETNNSLEKTKSLVKESLDQIKFIASDPTKLKSIENLISDQFKFNTINVDSLKGEFNKNLGALSVKIEEMKSYIDKNKLPFPDPTGNLNAINATIAGIKIDLNSLSKFSDIQQYLTILKSSIDKLNVNPVVNITTQKIEDTDTKAALLQFSTSVNDLKTSFVNKIKDFENRLIFLEALVQPAIPSLKEKMDKTLEAQIEIGTSISSEVISKLIEYKLDERIISKLQVYVDSVLSNQQKTSEDLKSSMEKELKNYFENSQKDFERIVNQKIFDLTIQLEDIVSGLLRKELSVYLSNLKIDVPPITVQSNDSKEEVMSLLGIVKQTIQSCFVGMEPTIYIVDEFHQLKHLHTKPGQEAVVKKYGFIFKRPVWFKFDGIEWVRL